MAKNDTHYFSLCLFSVGFLNLMFEIFLELNKNVNNKKVNSSSEMRIHA